MIRRLYQDIKENSIFLWKLKGSPVPPPRKYKEHELQVYGRNNGCKAFIETGTLHGNTLNAEIPYFDYLASVELSEKLYHNAEKRFLNMSKVHLYFGDSGSMLEKMIDDIPDNYKGSTLFWLDAHYSAGETARGSLDTPIIQELNIIFRKLRDHYVILIDDAREFVGKNNYPPLEELELFVKRSIPNCQWCVKNDIIRIVN